MRSGKEREMKTKSRYNTARKWLIFWTLFIGIGAVAGSVGMFADPSGKAMGMDAMLPYFKKLPFADVLFKDYLFSGFALLIVNGLTNLTASAFLFAKKRVGAILGTIFGVTLMLWICIQFYMFPFNFMSTSYFFFGLFQAICGYCACVFEKQERFRVDISDYPNIGTNKNQLVVYFSRMGYVKKQAFIEAQMTGAEVYEVKATEKTGGTLGFWWCGRFAMHGWEMPIEPIAVDLTKYEKVTICTPVWAFSLSAPIRAFCRQASGKIKDVDYVLVHFTKGRYKNIADEMDELLNVKNTSCKNVSCHMGKFSTY